MLSLKEKVLNAVAELPSDVEFEDILEHLYFLHKVETGLRQVSSGDTIPHQELTILPKVTVHSNPDPEILNYMERQAELFRQMKDELLKQYEGLYLLFEDGQVLDIDQDESALFLRNYSERKPIFIKKVVTVEPTLSIRGFLP